MTTTASTIRRNVLTYLALSLVAIVFLLPFAWMLSTSIKPLNEAMKFPPTLWPQTWRFENYVDIWTGYAPFETFYLNSFLTTVLPLVGTILSSVFAAYGFARLEWPGRNLLFILLLGTMMIPFHVTMVPVYIIFRNLRWIDTLWPLIVPKLFGHAFFIFLLRQFLMTIPRDLDEAATIDGASRLRVLVQILIPQIMPAMLTVAIFAFTWYWNDYLHPLLYLDSMENFTVAIGLTMFTDTYTGQYHLMMAAAVVALLPILILYVVAQRYFVEGVVLTGMKG